MSEFFAMGGYAGFVWSAYAVAAIVMIGLLVQTVRSLRARAAELDSLGGNNSGGAQ